MTQEEQPEEVEEIVVEEQKVTREDVIEAVERIAKDWPASAWSSQRPSR